MGFLRDYIIEQINTRPLEFSKSPLGRLMLNTTQHLLPSQYQVDTYRVRGTKSPVKVVFAGAPDSRFSRVAQRAFKKAYPDDPNVFTFGHTQLQEALKFAQQLQGHPVKVYGWSWGSNAAKDFINRSGLDIKQAHFLDPMRKDLTHGPQLKLRPFVKKLTYTGALPYVQESRRLDNAQLNALRWDPPKRAKILKAVKDHIAIKQWLQRLKQEQTSK